MERDVGDWFWVGSGRLASGEADNDAKSLAQYMTKLPYLPIRELNWLVSLYACSCRAELPHPLPTSIPQVVYDRKVSESGCWGELACRLPIGSLGLLQTQEPFYQGEDKGSFNQGRVPFVVVGKPANPMLGTVSVAILKLQRLRANFAPSKPYPQIPGDLADDAAESRFAAVELWANPGLPVQIDYEAFPDDRDRAPIHSMFVGSKAQPLLEFIDPTDYREDLTDGVRHVWAFLAGLAPEINESPRWYQPVQTLLHAPRPPRLPPNPPTQQHPANH